MTSGNIWNTRDSFANVTVPQFRRKVVHAVGAEERKLHWLKQFFPVTDFFLGFCSWWIHFLSPDFALFEGFSLVEMSLLTCIWWQTCENNVNSFFTRIWAVIYCEVVRWVGYVDCVCVWRSCDYYCMAVFTERSPVWHCWAWSIHEWRLGTCHSLQRR